MKNKTIDVIIPAYNNGKYLIDAINSVLIQNDFVHKILVIDDGSTDNSKKIITSLKLLHPKIQYYYQENKGLSAARNAGIKMSTAKYLAFLDADDIWLPNKLKKQLYIFSQTKYRRLGLVYGEYLDIDEKGNEIKNFGGFRLHPQIKGKVSKELLECNYATGSGSAVLVKKECFDRVGMFDKTLKACEDWDMWMRIAQEYDFDYVDEPLVKLRRHQNSMQADRYHMISNQVKLIAKMERSNLEVSSNMKRDLRREILGVIISNPFIASLYTLLKSVAPDRGDKWGYFREYITDLVWATYCSIPILSRIATNKIIRKVIINPLNRFLMEK